METIGEKITEIRKRKGVMTLAIGDGANDESMILKVTASPWLASMRG